MRHVDRDYVYCREQLASERIDIEAENAAAMAEASVLRHTHRMPFDAIVVPGYTPIDQVVAVPGLHVIAKERLLRAALDFDRNLAPFIVVSGGSVYPANTPYNEALEMKRFLVDGGFPEQRVFVEPCARHSHTNLRNTARLLMSAGLNRAMITTSFDQAYYFGRARTSSFEARQRADFGYLVGRLRQADEHHVAFLPDPLSFARGRDPLDP